jgi:hypothetical protein
MRASVSAAVLVGILTASRAGLAQPMAPETLPPALKPWMSWVLDGALDRACPQVAGRTVCSWPGRLVLDVSDAGGRFELEAHADRELSLPLPGGPKSWPQSVTLDGRIVPVITEASTSSPIVRVAAGDHTIRGELAWSELPDALPIPAEQGLVELTVGGHVVPMPKREGNLLLLKTQGPSAAGNENLQLKVFRRLEDGIPLWLETHLAIEASGKAREVRLEGALVPGAVAVAVRGDLPARLDPGGVLRVQVRPGRFAVRVLARIEGQPATLGPAKAVSPWPGQEIWLWAPSERLRQVEVRGPSAIDTSRTEVPDEWKALPAYLMDENARIALNEKRRGEPEAPSDQLTLARTFWLDLDGRAFSVRDDLQGQVGATTRLDLKHPGELGRASLSGTDQLITNAPGRPDGGVELRTTTIALEADSRVPRTTRLLAVGWTADVQSLRARLNLPPGWTLLAALGVDEAPGTWAARWDLLSVFLVVLTTFLAVTQLGVRWGVLAFLTLALTYGERGAPQVLWLALLAVATLRARLPGPRASALLRGLYALSLALLVFFTASFIFDHVRAGLYPQTAQAGGDERALTIDRTSGLASTRSLGAPPPPPAMAVPQEMVPAAPAADNTRTDGPQRQEQELKSKVQEQSLNRVASNYLSSAGKARQVYEQDPKAVIQTGPGVPSWAWSSHSLSWSGPVDNAHTMRLVLLSPGVNAGLALIRALLVALLAMRLGREWLRGRVPPRLAFIVAPLILLALRLATPAYAEEAKAPAPGASFAGGVFPSAELLEEMRERLTRRAPCEPACVTTARLHVAVSGNELRIESEVHAAATAAWPVPGPAETWVPRSILLDGQPTQSALARLEDGFLHLRLPAGVHRVQLAGPLAADSMTLQMPDRPRRITGSSSDWQIDGIREDGTSAGSIQLTRRAARAGGSGQADGVYEPWLEVTRVLDIGIAWRAETIVRRVSPAGVPILVKVPLLKGMLVTDAEHPVQDGEVTVSLGRDQTATRWSSTLPPVEGEPIVLEAPAGRPWSEVWMVRCGTAWQCEASGLVPVARRDGDLLAAEFRPWPGERLTLSFRRPGGQPGQSLTIDDAALAVVPGIRLRDVTLDLKARASRTSMLTLALPAGADLREVRLDGAVKPLRREGDSLALSIDGGAHAVHVAWREKEGGGVFLRAPHVGLGQPAVNAHVSLSLPGARWLLLAGGPPWGPVVLFWLDLALLLVVAWVLSRIAGPPLARGEWLLLAAGLAFAGLPFAVLAFLAGWFFALSWRARRADLTPRAHNAVQGVLALWTAFFLLVLTAAVVNELAGTPDMQVTGGAGGLQWYVDRVSGDLPRPWALSVPLAVYRGLMLAWALWLVTAVLRWLRWGWSSFSAGAIWKKSPVAAAPAPVADKAGE